MRRGRPKYKRVRYGRQACDFCFAPGFGSSIFVFVPTPYGVPPASSPARSPVRFPGWRIAWALAITQTVGYGVLTYSFGVFTLPMELETGWTRAQTSGAFSLALLVSGLAAFPVGRWVDTRGARGIMSIGSLIGSALVLLWSFVTSLPALYLVQAGIGLVMAAVLYDVAFTVIATWFRRDRIRAMLLVTMVAGLASTIFIPLATLLVETFGWREALRILALLLAVLTVPLHALVLRDNPRRLGFEPDGGRAGQAGNRASGDTEERSVTARAAFRSRVFWWLAAAFTLDSIANIGVVAHVVPLLTERGYAPGVVAMVAGSIGVMQVLGRLVFAPATRRISLGVLAVWTYGLRAVALVILLLVPGTWGLWLFAAIFGVANGASTLARAGLVAETFGPAHFGSITGSMTTMVSLLHTVAPLSVGLLRVRTGSYEIAVWLLIGVAALAAFAAWRARTQAPPA